MQIGVIQNGKKNKIDLTKVDQVFLDDGKRLVPLTKPESIKRFAEYIKQFLNINNIFPIE